MPSVSVPDHLRALVGRLDLAQKVRLLTGADFWALHEEPTIGLRRVVTSDGPAGVRGELWDERDPSLNLPSPTALGASWDTGLVEELGALLAEEAHRKGVAVVLAPTLNLHRSPYGGRHFECFAEDPLLIGAVGAALVRGLQSQGVAATAKHFVANDSETERLTVDARMDERTLREVYLPPFEEAVRAGAWAVMAAYNGVNGHTMTASPLLRDVLREEWGFDGVVMTDWYAGRSTVPTARGSLDLMMPGPTGPWGADLVAAVTDGLVPEEAVDEKVGRILQLAERVGRLGEACSARPRPGPAQRPDALLRRAAAAGFVLVRNEPVTAGRPILPLRPDVRRIAVIGPNAREARFLGGGSALVFPPHTVSPLAGISALGDGVEVTYYQGVRGHERVSAADPALLTTPSGDQGILVTFRSADGSVLGTDRRPGSVFNWNNAFEGVDPDLIGSIVLETTLRADREGDYRIGSAGVGRFVLEIDGEIGYDERVHLPEGADPVEALMRPPQQWVTRRLTAGQEVRIRLSRFVDDHVPGTDLLVSLQLAIDCVIDDEHELAVAERAAGEADVAIVVVGTNEEVESEGFDRGDLRLPGRQDELVRRVAAARPETVVVVNAGSPVLLPWREEVAAVLLSWFPGQEFGRALADVLTGTTEPGGRLPTTWPATEEAALPSTTPQDGVLVYAEGLHVGHRRFLRDGVAPAYWFGHGLGYTSWSYGDVAASATSDGAEVAVEVTNTGERAGDCVVQVYLTRPGSALERPVRWLAGFTRHTAGPGETSGVVVALPRRSFAHWDGGWQVEPGEYDVLVGRSAGDIAARTTVVLPGRP